MKDLRIVQTRTKSEKDEKKEFVNFYLILPSNRFVAIKCAFPEDFGRLVDIAPIVTKEQLKAHEF